MMAYIIDDIYFSFCHNFDFRMTVFKSVLSSRTYIIMYGRKHTWWTQAGGWATEGR